MDVEVFGGGGRCPRCTPPSPASVPRLVAGHGGPCRTGRDPCRLGKGVRSHRASAQPIRCCGPGRRKAANSSWSWRAGTIRTNRPPTHRGTRTRPCSDGSSRTSASTPFPPPALRRPVPPTDRDRSVQIHVCYGARRQVEVLRDAILHVLAADATLEPRDVAIMTPDLATFAPLLEAVFLGAAGGGEPGPRRRHPRRAGRRRYPARSAPPDRGPGAGRYQPLGPVRGNRPRPGLLPTRSGHGTRTGGDAGRAATVRIRRGDGPTRSPR